MYSPSGEKGSPSRSGSWVSTPPPAHPSSTSSPTLPPPHRSQRQLGIWRRLRGLIHRIHNTELPYVHYVYTHCYTCTVYLQIREVGIMYTTVQWTNDTHFFLMVEKQLMLFTQMPDKPLTHDYSQNDQDDPNNSWTNFPFFSPSPSPSPWTRSRDKQIKR